MKYVEVIWIDSGMHVDYGWATTEKYKEGTTLDKMRVTTVGMLIDLTPEIVLVGLCRDPAHDKWFGAQVIDRKAVEGFRYLS